MSPRSSNRPLVSRTALRVGFAGAFAALLLPATSASAATWHREDFESGATGDWTGSSNVDVVPAAAHNGDYGVRAVTTPDKSGFLSWRRPDVTEGKRYARISGWVKIASCDCSDNVGVLNVKNDSGVNHFDLWRDKSTGRFRYDLLDVDNGYSTMRAEVGEWYFVEVLLDFGGSGVASYTADVRINGIDQPSITSNLQVGTTVKSAWFGGRTVGRTNTRYYDDLAFAVGDEPFPFIR